MTRDPTDTSADVAAALLILARCNIPTDIQELLVRGDPMRDIPPNALGKAIENVIEFYAAAYVNRWQPISTAPTDGTRFLASDDYESGIVSIIKRHDPGGQRKNQRHNYECWVTDFNEPGPAPTHWMPLPTPPEAT